MLVNFKSPWFGPSRVVIKDKIQSISGRRFKKGVQEVDESLREHLPKSAKILEKPPEEEVVEESTNLKDYDQSRLDGDRLVQREEAAEAQIKATKQARASHARAAKGARKGDKTVE